MKSAKKKNNSGNKTNRDDNNKMRKSQSHYNLPAKKRQFSESKQKPLIKKTHSKKRVQRISTIEERISNIKKGFQELQRKIVHSQQVTESLTQPDIKKLMQSATRSIRTRNHNKSNSKSSQKSKSKSKSNQKAKQKKCHSNCVYSKAVFNLINIINYQKAQIQNLKQQLKRHSHR